MKWNCKTRNRRLLETNRRLAGGWAVVPLHFFQRHAHPPAIRTTDSFLIRVLVGAFAGEIRFLNCVLLSTIAPPRRVGTVLDRLWDGDMRFKNRAKGVFASNVIKSWDNAADYEGK